MTSLYLVRRNVTAATIFVIAALASMPASAGVLIDHSPQALGTMVAADVANGAGGQNFLVEFTLAQPTWISGMDIYGLMSGPATAVQSVTGPATTIKIRQDGINGLPASTNLFSLSSMFSEEQTIAFGNAFVQWRHSAFTPTLLSSGTWWIGLSYSTDSGSWASIKSGVSQPTNQVQLARDNFDQCCIGSTFPTTFTPYPNIYALAYQIEGSAETVPEPPVAPTLMILSAGWMAWRVRARSRDAQPAVLSVPHRGWRQRRRAQFSPRRSRLAA